MRVDEVANGFADAGPQAVLVRPTRRGGDAIDVRTNVLVRRLGPLHDEIEPNSFISLQDEGRLVNRFGSSLGHDLLQIVDDSFRVLEDRFFLGGLVFEGNLDTLVQVAHDFEPLFDNGGVELDLRKDGRVGMEVDGRAGAAGRPELFQRSDGLALLETHLPLRAVSFHGRDELLRQRVDDAGPDAVQPAGRLVTALFELAAGVEHREDDF